MYYLIDAYNLIGYCKTIHLHDINKEEKLLTLIETIPFKKKDLIELVFDGKSDLSPWGSQNSHNNIRCIFTAHDQNADHFIINKLTLNKDIITVISSDNEIKQACKKQHNCHIINCQEFLKKVLPSPKKSTKPNKSSKEETNYWLNLWKNKNTKSSSIS
ncbi:MAG: NYN domain-containing protein [bacterium]